MKGKQRSLFEESKSENDVPEGDSLNTEKKTDITATPFVKWAGGKRSIMHHLLERLPEEINRYYEPFVGGGALFFELSSRSLDTVLSDTNFDLIITYKAIQRDVQALIERLERHAKEHGKDYYYKIRKRHWQEDPIEIAARFLYLNRTCYNGLWRVNKKGEFNVPIGSYKNPSIAQKDKLLSCHSVLQSVEIKWLDFHEINPEEGDFVYFDPPYHPTDDTSFTKYSRLDFTEQDQLRLRDFALELHRRGVKLMLSNSDTKFIRDIYDNRVFHIGEVQAPRPVNCKPSGRGNVSEVLITNYV